MESVEIIVGCYKQEEWLDGAIWSARNQIVVAPLNYKRSPDILPYMLSDYKIRIVHDHCKEEKGTGASATRNRAIKESTADWIIWLDADDLLPSHYLHKMLDSLRSGNCYGDKNIHRAGVQFIAGARLEKLDYCSIIESDNLDHKGVRYPMCMSAMFPRQAWLTVGGFDEDLYNMNDLDFWVRCSNAGYNFIPADTFLLRRNVPGSLIDKGAAMEEKILKQFNKKHNTRLTKKLLPYRVPMQDEC